MHQKSSAWFKAYPTAAGKKFRKRGSGPATKAVDLYPNRLVIWNLGKLPPGIRIWSTTIILHYQRQLKLTVTPV